MPFDPLSLAIGGASLLGGLFGGSRSAPAAVQVNPQGDIGVAESSLFNLYPHLVDLEEAQGPRVAGSQAGNLSSFLLGKFDPGSFWAANPQILADWESQRAAGGLQGWTPEQFAQANLGSTDALNQYRQGGLISQLGAIAPQIDRLNLASAAAQRGGDLADVQALAPQYDSLRRSLNPEAYAALGGLAGYSAPSQPTDAYNRATSLAGMLTPSLNLGPRAQAMQFDPSSMLASAPADPMLARLNRGDALGSMLERQAASELALGDQLAPDEARAVRVQSRAAADARGRGFSNAALADEVLNSYQARQNRLAQRRSFAQGVQGNAFSQRLGTVGANQAAAGLGIDATRANQGYLLGSFDANRRSYMDTLGYNADLAQREATFNRDSAAQLFNQNLALDQASLARLGADYSRAAGTAQLGLASMYDPMQALGRAPANTLNTGGVAGMGLPFAAGGNAFNTYGQMLGAITSGSNFNANAQNARNIAGYNAGQSMAGGLLNGGLGLIGLGLG